MCTYHSEEVHPKEYPSSPMRLSCKKGHLHREGLHSPYRSVFNVSILPLCLMIDYLHRQDHDHIVCLADNEVVAFGDKVPNQHILGYCM